MTAVDRTVISDLRNPHPDDGGLPPPWGTPDRVLAMSEAATAARTLDRRLTVFRCQAPACADKRWHISSCRVGSRSSDGGWIGGSRAQRYARQFIIYDPSHTTQERAS